eukprot:GEMP01040074.1.p1 GENE.GEMP01040074.1~~GEMP01040074.1.p1  ORF type:complete len:371 (+),score=100.11 GEMP01040074.1:112-1224(+)
MQAWGVSCVFDDSSEAAACKNGGELEAFLTDVDLRKASMKSKIPEGINSEKNLTLAGRHLVQVMKIVDITQPAKFREEFEGGKWRLLRIEFVDANKSKMNAIEYRQCTALSVSTPPGTKVVLGPDIQVKNGHILLEPSVIRVVGGHVEQLVNAWQVSQDVEKNRLLWKTEGGKQGEKMGDGAPPFEKFDPGKKYDVQFEPREAKKVLEQKDDAGPRFNRTELGDAGDKVHTSVGASAFKKVDTPAKGKGKGKDKDGGAWGRSRDTEPEEKRRDAGHASLAAFITGGEALIEENKRVAQTDSNWAHNDHGEDSWGASGGGGNWGTSGGNKRDGKGKSGGGGGKGKGGGGKGKGGKTGGGKGKGYGGGASYY